jgi:hypothetical protein
MDVQSSNICDILSQLYSDVWFITGITEAIRMQIAVGLSSVPIYFYHFAFDGNLGLSHLLLGSNRLSGKSSANTY